MNQHTPPSQQDIETALGLTSGQKRGKLLRRVLLALGVLAVGAVGYYAYAQSRNAGETITYETVPATTGDVVVTVSATGKIEPITQVEIGSEASGVVREVMVDENTQVKTGDVLVVLDTTRLLAQQQRAAAQLSGAEARVAEAKATRAERFLLENRIKSLRAKGLSTGQEMDTAEAATKRAEAALLAAEAEIAAARAELSIIETDISKTRILSPIDGVVLKRSIEPGQTVAASLQAPVLFQIAQDLKRIQVEAAVDEADIGAVKVGQSASFTVDAYRNQNFPARIERLSFAPETVDGVVTYKALLSADNQSLALRPGMTATSRITVEEHANALTVPNEALRFQPPTQQAAESFSITRMFMPRFPRGQRNKREVATDGTRPLYVLEGGKPVERRVKTGATDGKKTVILSGDVADGDQVVIAQARAGAAR